MFLAKSGREGIDLFREYRPRVLITDWMMPDFSGIDLCRHIRENFKEPYTHILILTANTESDGLVRGLQAGADDYLLQVGSARWNAAVPGWQAQVSYSLQCTA